MSSRTERCYLLHQVDEVQTTQASISHCRQSHQLPQELHEHFYSFTVKRKKQPGNFISNWFNTLLYISPISHCVQSALLEYAIL